MPTHAEIVEWVEQNVGAPTTYGRVAAELGTHARVVGRAMRAAPDWFDKAYLVLMYDWTVHPDFQGSKGMGPAEAAARLEAAGYPTIKLPNGSYRLAHPPGK